MVTEVTEDEEKGAPHCELGFKMLYYESKHPEFNSSQRSSPQVPSLTGLKIAGVMPSKLITFLLLRSWTIDSQQCVFLREEVLQHCNDTVNSFSHTFKMNLIYPIYLI